jgi:hypothetical protein
MLRGSSLLKPTWERASIAVGFAPKSHSDFSQYCRLDVRAGGEGKVE